MKKHPHGSANSCLGEISFFHDLFTVIWMGGLLVTVLAYLTAVKNSLGAGPQVKKVMTEFQKRQCVWVYLSIAGLILKGLLMTNHSPQFESLFRFGKPYSVALSTTHILAIAMIGVSLYRVLGRSTMTPEKERLNMKLLFINAALAVLVMLTSGFAAALARPPKHKKEKI